MYVVSIEPSDFKKRVYIFVFDKIDGYRIVDVLSKNK